jgi:hypothetical protein
MASEEAVSDEERWIEAVTRMIQLTQSGELEWRIGENYGPGRGDPTTPPYVTEYKDTIYRLQGRWVKTEVTETYAMRMLRNLAVHGPVPHRTPRLDGEVVRLEMIDPQGRSLYRVPNVSPIRNLLYAVQRQTADPEAALQDLLG